MNEKENTKTLWIVLSISLTVAIIIAVILFVTLFPKNFTEPKYWQKEKQINNNLVSRVDRDLNQYFPNTFMENGQIKTIGYKDNNFSITYLTTDLSNDNRCIYINYFLNSDFDINQQLEDIYNNNFANFPNTQTQISYSFQYRTYDDNLFNNENFLFKFGDYKILSSVISKPLKEEQNVFYFASFIMQKKNTFDLLSISNYKYLYSNKACVSENYFSNFTDKASNFYSFLTFLTI